MLIREIAEVPGSGTHDLLFLKNICSNYDIQIDFNDKDLDFLTDNGSRVSNPTSVVNEIEMRKGIEIANGLRNLIRKNLNL